MLVLTLARPWIGEPCYARKAPRGSQKKRALTRELEVVVAKQLDPIDENRVAVPGGMMLMSQALNCSRRVGRLEGSPTRHYPPILGSSFTQVGGDTLCTTSKARNVRIELNCYRVWVI